MNELILYIDDNKEWIFSGLGIFLIGLIVAAIKKIFFSKQKSLHSMNQVNTDYSHGVQVGIQNNYNKRDEGHAE